MHKALACFVLKWLFFTKYISLHPAMSGGGPLLPFTLWETSAFYKTGISSARPSPKGSRPAFTIY